MSMLFNTLPRFIMNVKSSKLKFHETKCKEKHNGDNYHEKSWESLGQQGDPTSTSWRKSTLDSHWKDSCWSWNSNTLATWCEELTHWKRPWCWERLRAGGEGDDRGWDGWMTSPTRWTWVWASSESWWYIGKHGVFLSTGSQQIGHNWAAELIQFNVCLKLHRCSFPHY